MVTASRTASVSTIHISHDRPPDLVEVPSEYVVVENTKTRTDDVPTTIVTKWWNYVRTYANKFRGLHEERPKRLPWHEYFWSFTGALLGIALVAFLHYRLVEQRQLSFLIGSFGASAVLIFGAPRSPLAQPRNLVGGHVISAICGCTVRVAIDSFEHSIACALAVALAIIAMQLTETLHPPGGATALLAITARPLLPGAHFLFILMPVLTGALAMLLVALIVNNLASKRTYPTFWW